MGGSCRPLGFATSFLGKLHKKELYFCINGEEVSVVCQASFFQLASKKLPP